MYCGTARIDTGDKVEMASGMRYYQKKMGMHGVVSEQWKEHFVTTTAGKGSGYVRKVYKSLSMPNTRDGDFELCDSNYKARSRSVKFRQPGVGYRQFSGNIARIENNSYSLGLNDYICSESEIHPYFLSNSSLFFI